ncbi:hypothetical protein AVEN_136081-1, partial [Araneus ventricosus]
DRFALAGTPINVLSDSHCQIHRAPQQLIDQYHISNSFFPSSAYGWELEDYKNKNMLKDTSGATATD